MARMVHAGDSPSTLEIEESNIQGAARGDEAMLALLIAWADAEPERVGEVALFEHGAGATILGRGAGATEGGRVVFYRQRPGLLERRPPLASPGISSTRGSSPSTTAVSSPTVASGSP